MFLFPPPPFLPLLLHTNAVFTNAKEISLTAVTLTEKVALCLLVSSFVSYRLYRSKTLQNSSSAGVLLHTSFSTTLTLSSHKQRMLSLLPTCASVHWIRQQKFTSQQSRIRSASTQKEIWYTALRSLNNLTFNNVFLCELVQHFTHDKLCGYCLPYLK